MIFQFMLAVDGIILMAMYGFMWKTELPEFNLGPILAQQARRPE